MKLSIVCFLLTVATLACGVSAQLPTAPLQGTPYNTATVAVISSSTQAVIFVACRGTVNIRSDAGTDNAIVRAPLAYNERVTWTGQSKIVSVIPWYRVVTTDGFLGYVRSDYLCKEAK